MAGSQKQMIVVGGPNGSGKTTFAMSCLGDSTCEYLGADQIAAELSPNSPESAAIAAGRLFVERLSDRIDRGQSVIVESTLSGKSLLRHIERASREGFEVVVFFTFVDSAEACVARVRHRVSLGGHHVPEEDIRRRYRKSLRNFWESYRFAADHWLLFFNSGEDCLATASGVADNYLTLQEGPFAQFLAAVEGQTQ